MMDKEELKENLIITLLLILLAGSYIWIQHCSRAAIDSENRKYAQKLKEFEKSVETASEEVRKESEYWKENIKKYPVEERREKFVTDGQLDELFKKYLTPQEYFTFMMLGIKSLEQNLTAAEGYIFIYYMNKVFTSVTPEEKKIFDEMHEQNVRLNKMRETVDPPKPGKK